MPCMCLNWKLWGDYIHKWLDIVKLNISNQYVIWAVFSSKLKTNKPYDLHSFLGGHFMGKLLVVCQNVRCFLNCLFVCFILQEWHCWFRRGKKAVRRSSGVTPSYARLLHGYPPAMEGTFCSRFFFVNYKGYIKLQ